MLLLTILISSVLLIIVPKEYFFYWLVFENVAILFSIVYYPKPKKRTRIINNYMTMLVIALLLLYVPVTILIINNYILLILEGGFTIIHLAATLFPMVLLLFWYIYLNDIDDSKNSRIILYFLPGASIIGIFLAVGLVGVLPFILTILIILLLVKTPINNYIKWIFIFFVINPKIQYIFLKLNEQKIFRDIDIKISLNYAFDLIVLLCLLLIVFSDRIIKFIKRNYSETMGVLVISIGLVIAGFLFEFVLLSNVKIFTLMLNKMVVMNNFNIGKLNVPNIGLMITVIEVLMASYIYYYLTKKLKFSSGKTFFCLVPYFFYVFLF